MGEIEIKLEGSVGKEKLRPEHVDIYKNTDPDAWLEDLRDGAYA